jgi:hypothetical protein
MLDALPMRSKFKFVPSPSPLFGASGRKALWFEAYQFPLVLVQSLPCFAILALIYFVEPFVKLDDHFVTLPSSPDGSTPPTAVLDPVGYSSLVMTGTLAAMMGCSFAVTVGLHPTTCRMNVLMSLLYFALLATYFLAIHALAKSMAYKLSFYAIDVLLMVLLYLIWIIVKAKKIQLGVGARYPRTNQVESVSGGGAVDKTRVESQTRHNGILLATLLPVALLGIYMFILIPAFATSPPPVQFVLRVFGHTFIKSQSDVRQRDGFATNTFHSTCKAMSVNMYAMESVFGIAGRFLMTAGAGSSYSWYCASLVCTAYMEWFMRVNAEALEYRFIKATKRKPLEGMALRNYRVAEASSQAQDDAVEQAACLITGAMMIATWNQRAALNLGFGNEMMLKELLVVSLLQLLVEIPTDVITTAQIIDDGILVHEYYMINVEDGVETPHSVTFKVVESCSLVFGMFTSLVFFRISPIPGWCGTDDLCSCSFVGEQLRELCNAGGSFKG